MHYIYPNGDEVSIIDIVYVCKEFSGTLKCQQGEVDDLKFFRVNEIPDNITNANRNAIEKWVKENS